MAHDGTLDVVSDKPSRSVGHRHIIVSIGRGVKDAYERVMLQAALGTDPKHTMIALLQLRKGADPDVVSVFFE